MNFSKLMKMAEATKEAGKLHKALKFYDRAFGVLAKKASTRVNEKIGSVWEFIENSARYDYEVTKDFTVDEWCTAHETDEELKKFEKKHDELFKACLKEDKMTHIICQEMGTIYSKIRQPKKAKIFFEEAAYFASVNTMVGIADATFVKSPPK